MTADSIEKRVASLEAQVASLKSTKKATASRASVLIDTTPPTKMSSIDLVDNLLELTYYFEPDDPVARPADASALQVFRDGLSELRARVIDRWKIGEKKEASA